MPCWQHLTYPADHTAALSAVSDHVTGTGTYLTSCDTANLDPVASIGRPNLMASVQSAGQLTSWIRLLVDTT